MLDFEEAFSDFLDRREYDQAESALFSMVRTAFKAGWLAAGGKALEPQKIIELAQPHRGIPLPIPSGVIETDNTP